MAVLFIGSSSQLSAQGVQLDYTYSESNALSGTPTPAYDDIDVAPGISGSTNMTGFPVSADFNTIANATVSIGFNFVFNNKTYSSLTISDNGFITFGVTTPGTSTTPLSGATAFEGAIAAYGSNLGGQVADNPNISYILTGTSGSQVFIVQYKNMKRYFGFPAGYRDGLINMQIRLYEGTNKIQIQYGNTTPTTYTTQTTGQIGLRGANNTFNPNVNNRQNSVSGSPALNYFYPSIAGTANNSSMITNAPTAPISYTIWPTNDVMFQWTPSCFVATALSVNLQVDNASAIFNWTGAAWPTGQTYDWEVRTSGGAGSGATGLFASGNTSSTSQFIGGLTVGTTYTVYVKTSCKAWTTAISGTVTPSCLTPVFPYTENFEGVAVPAIPNCTSVVATTGLTFRTVDRTSTPYYGFTNKNLVTGNTVPTDTWFFSRGITLTPGNSYKLTYTYGGSRELAQFTQKMKVAFGTSAAVASMTNIVADHDNIKTSPNTYIVNFIVPGAGPAATYYLGFNGYAGNNNGYLQIDDISLNDSTCLRPTATTSGQITHNSALISWTAPVSAPSGGYQYYLSTSATSPIGTTISTGSTAAGGVVATLTGLTPSTTYYFWVRSNCGGGETSAWSVVSSFTTLAAPPTPCLPAPTSVDSSGIVNVTFGTINNTTGVETNNYGDYTYLSTNVAQTTTVNISLKYSILGFVGGGYYTRVWIDWNNDGDFYDAGETVYTNGGAELPNGTSTISFVVPSSVAGVANTAGPHRLRIGGADSADLSLTGAGQGPCYTGTWGTFEDYSIYVTSPPPALSVLDANSAVSTTVCAGNSSPLVSVTTGFGPATLYTWSPNTGVSGSIGAGFTFTPSSTTVYTLTATQTTGSFLSNTATYTVNVTPLPTAITISPTAGTLCQGSSQALTASGGIVSGVTILDENFNNPTNSFTLVHNSVNGTPALAYWMLHSSPYSIPAANTDDPLTISSNDASQFYMSDSDIQGSLGNTNEELITPAFSLVGYTDASLSFWHYYKQFSNGSAKVEISTSGGAPGTWVTLPGATWTTTSQGSATNFVNVVLNLSAYAFPGNTNSNVKIRFIYVSNYGYRWAIDNVKITGSSSATVVWSPVTDLYQDSGLTIPYVANTPLATVYTKTSSTITYTASAATLTVPVCTTSTNVTITVIPLSGGTAVGNQSVNCGNMLSSNITLSGYIPASLANITRWEYSNDSTFPVSGTFTIPGSANVDTITPAMMGLISGTTYVRAVITGCNVAYSTYATITVASVTWNGSAWSPGAPTSSDRVIINGNLTISADMSVCSMQILSGNVVVNSGVTLTVDNALNVVTPGTMTFLNSASLMQSPTATTNSNTVTGPALSTFRYQRSTNMRKYDFTYWSSPTQIITLGNFISTLSDKYLRFDSNLYQWVSVINSTPFTPGQGYAIRAPLAYDVNTPSLFTGNFTGTPNNGNYTYTVYKSGANDLNLIGNPYPSPLSANLLMDGNAGVLGTAGVGTTLYFWTHNTLNPGVGGYSPSDYAVYNRTGGTAGSPGTNSTPPYDSLLDDCLISAGQGFVIAAVASGTNTITFRNNMRTTGANSRFYRNGQTLEKNRIWLDLSNDSGVFKEVLVGYIENATNEFENGFDGKVIEAGNAISFYSLLGTDNLAIQGRALPFVNTDQVPLGYKSSTSGNYQISLSKFDGLFNDVNVGVYLEDTLLNTIHDLRQGAYSFVTEAGTFDSRFVLRFNNSLLNVNPSEVSENSVIAYKQNESIKIQTSGFRMSEVQIFDARGRLILSQNNINDSKATFSNLSVANQLLLVQIKSIDGSIVTKKVLF